MDIVSLNFTDDCKMADIKKDRLFTTKLSISLVCTKFSHSQITVPSIFQAQIDSPRQMVQIKIGSISFYISKMTLRESSL